MNKNIVYDMKGKHNPRYIDGRKGTRLYRIYRNMLSRCYNKNTPTYHRYGKRNINVCEEWRNDYKYFYMWSMENGYSDELTIDRIDNNLGYCPNNCRWTDNKTQCRNTRRTHFVTLNGETKSLITWCEDFNINYRTVRDRLKRGWNYEKALSTPVDTRFQRKKVV